MNLFRTLRIAAGTRLQRCLCPRLSQQAGQDHRAVSRPGGATDIVTRIVAQKLTEVWGQSVIVENRSGAGGNIGGEAAAKSTPDGYTLFMTSGSIVTANQYIYKKMPFDPAKDLLPITNVASGPAGNRGEPEFPGEDLEAIHRHGPRQAGRAQLRPRRHRQPDPSGRGELPVRREPQYHQRALQGRGSGHDRPGWRIRSTWRQPTSPARSASSTRASCARSPSPASSARRNCPMSRPWPKRCPASRTSAGSG